MTAAKADRIVPLATRSRPQASRPLLRQVLGEVLRASRRDQNRTLADVASASKISVPYLSEVERGRKEASSEVLAALSDALGVPLSRVLSEAGRALDDAVAEGARQERTAALRALRAVPARDLTPGPALTPSTIRGLTPAGDVLLLAA
jgi:transcriptional regulator with XRE-family HTH domain